MHCFNEWLKNITSALADRRRALLMSQQNVEERIGLSEHQISKWELGVRRPTAWNLYCWADALDCDVIIIPRERKPDA